jgi:hypothetical protein
MAESHRQAEEEKAKTEEANKTELEKRDESLANSIAVTTAQAETIKTLTIQNAIMRLAPAKNVPANLFSDLLMLMDTSTITLTDGKVVDEEVDKAIDATLVGREHMTVTPTNGKGYGSPSRSTPQKTNVPKPKQPVRRNRQASM